MCIRDSSKGIGKEMARKLSNLDYHIIICSRTKDELKNTADELSIDYFVCDISDKKNVDDMRESPSLVLIRSLLNLNAEVDYYDPFVPIIPPSREYNELTGMKGKKSLSKKINSYDAVIISTDHDCIDYALIGEHANLIIDTRNAMKFYESKAKIIKA